GRAAGDSYDGQVSDDGTTVLFRSGALNLTPPIPAGGQSLTNELYFLRSPATTNRMVDVFGTVAASPRPALTVPTYATSAEGRYVALLLASSSTNVVPAGLYRVDLDTGEYRSLTADVQGVLDTASSEFLSPSLSADGRVVVFEVQDVVPNSSRTLGPVVFAWEEGGGAPTRVSSGGWVTNSVGAIEESPYGSLLGASRDGQFVAFLGGSTNDAPNLAALQIVVRNRATGEMRRVSRARNGAPLDASDYPSVSFSDDGKRMVFQSANDGFVAEDLNRGWDVFLYDWDSDAVSPMSTASPARPSATAFGEVILGPGGVSGDGRYVAFLSLAEGLADGHESGVRDVYRADRTTGTLDWVSVGADAGGSAFSSSSVVLSRDGRFVAFASAADNLVAGDTNRFDDVFLRDMVEGTTTLVSRRPDGGFVPGPSSSPAISPDGRWVAFVSSSAGLVANHAGTQAQVYLFDRLNGQVTLASVTTGGAMPVDRPSGQPAFDPGSQWLLFESRSSALISPGPGTGRSVYAKRLADGALRRIAPPGLVAFGANVSGPTPVATFSADGRYAATLLATTAVADWDVFLHEFESGTTTRLFGPATGAAIANEATRVAYRTTATSTTGAFQIRVLDRATGLDRAVSVASDGAPGNGPCDPPSITPDGRWVSFGSAASNLVDGDDNGFSDVFLKDLDSGTTVRLGGNSLSASPVLSADARTLVFRSFSDDLVEGDENQSSDLFAAALPGPESEYRITAITRLSTGAVRLVWAATAGKTYRVQAATDPAGPWQDSGLTVVVEGNQ
ncbi:MAG: PD40 domain-containing protein, partial [Verrucomicrobiales bacterium]|nr:PD40 domain-containing protein [Verrucomicrobiales bacterium]